jgi:hypothetical protein
VVRVAVQLLARSDRRQLHDAWAWAPMLGALEVGGAHFARLHAACMDARPFARWSGRK